MTPDKDPPTETFVTGFPFPPKEIDDSDLPPLPPEMLAPLTEEEIEVREDMEWAYNDPEVQRLYPDMIVAVYRRKVVAVGGDWGKVLEEAERVTGVPGNHIAMVGIMGPSILER
jgi:hypothetical protein